MNGNNTKSNRANLTAREHFIAHHLLTKMYPENVSLQWALGRMMLNGRGQQRFLSARQFEIARIALSRAKSLCIGPLNANYGNRWTDEQKLEVSKRNMGKNMGNQNASKRLDVRLKNSQAKLGAKNPRAKPWKLQCRKTGKVVEFVGGIKPFLSNYIGSFNALLNKGKDPNWIRL